MMMDGDQFRQIHRELNVLSEKIDLIFKMMMDEKEQRLAALKAQQATKP